jgi:microcystin-dependent protein
MAQPYVGEIRLFAGNFAPAGWLFCDGSLLVIAENETLFQLIGTTYGGNGQTNFGIPDLRGRIPLHQGNGFTLAQTGGVETVTLSVNTIPSHNHLLQASNNIPAQATPANNVPGQAAAKIYRAGNPSVSLNAGSITPDGGSQPHSNFQPYQCINYIISLFGIFPSPT